MPNLSWQTVVVGDPLCAPFRTKSLSSSELDKGLDPSTELPVLFSGRNIQAVALPAYKQQQIQPNTTKLLLRAQSRLARGDGKGAREDLEEAVTRDNRLGPAQAQLAVMYEQSGEFDKAIARYRRLLELTPDKPLFLNNLAYALAVRKNSVEEALPLAEKANALGKGNPNIQDTLGWIYFLQGNKEKALPLLEEAVKQDPNNAEMNLHVAFVLEASDQVLAATQKLARALEIDPALANRPEVASLRKKLSR